MKFLHKNSRLCFGKIFYGNGECSPGWFMNSLSRLSGVCCVFMRIQEAGSVAGNSCVLASEDLGENLALHCVNSEF